MIERILDISFLIVGTLLLCVAGFDSYQSAKRMSEPAPIYLCEKSGASAMVCKKVVEK